MLWGKKSCHNWGLNHLLYACEASALTTEPPGPVLVEVTRMPIYTNALGQFPNTVIPSSFFCLNTFPQLFFFLFPFCFSFYLLPTSFCFVDFTFLLLFFPSFFLPIFCTSFFSFFLCLLFIWYVQPIIRNVRQLLNMQGHIVLALRNLI